MGRNRKSAKQAGAKFEKDIADYLAEHVDDRIERRRQEGAKDRGDIASVRTRHNERVVIEAKNYGGRLEPAAWTKEASKECENDNALVGLVVAKRLGTADPGRQWILGTVDDLVALLTGKRPV